MIDDHGGAGLSRRTLVLAAMIGPATLAAAPAGRNWLETLRSRAAALGGPGLLTSYEVAGDADFDRVHGNCAYVYDNAVVGLALLAGGEVALARRLGDGLIAAQARDRAWHDGRLRNAYAGGPTPADGPYPLPGFWDAAAARWVEDAYQVGTATGVVAWAMLLWIGLARATGDAEYTRAAARAADWVSGAVRGPHGFRGGLFGFEPSPASVQWVSTEHNLDLAAAFGALGRADAAEHARAFVRSMWDAPEGRFFSGLTPEGTPNPHSAVDANVWPLLVPGGRPEWSAALDWLLSHHNLPVGSTPATCDGVDFDTDRDGIWLEGTAMTALTLKMRGRDASRFIRTLHEQTSSSGLIWACSPPRLTTGLSTGLTTKPDFFYYRRPHIAPTAWAVLADLKANPFPQDLKPGG